MLVAAHNPGVALDETTSLEISYRGAVLGNIEVRGLNTELVLFELP
jgi:hypothetical protein